MNDDDDDSDVEQYVRGVLMPFLLRKLQIIFFLHII